MKKKDRFETWRLMNAPAHRTRIGETTALCGKPTGGLLWTKIGPGDIQPKICKGCWDVEKKIKSHKGPVSAGLRKKRKPDSRKPMPDTEREIVAKQMIEKLRKENPDCEATKRTIEMLKRGIR